MNSPLGGELVDRTCPAGDVAAKLEYAKSLPSLPANRNLVLDTEKIANGTFSPLTGFMGRDDTESVLTSMRMKDGTPWTIPVVFHADRARAESLQNGDDVAIVDDADDSVAAVMTVREVYDYDKERFCASVFGTTDAAHPGVGQVLEWGDVLVAGDVELLKRSASDIPGTYDLSPTEVRAEIAKRGWKTIVGFQTRNLGHKAHEHLQKTALEQVDGLLIHPLIGWKKRGDMMPDVIVEGYEVLVDKYFVKSKVMLAALTTAMRYAGPKEAVFHAIIRKNFGCSHFIVGRDHAGVGDYYAKYAGHAIFDEFDEAELGIVPMRLHGPCWCDKCAHIVTEHTCPHEDSWRQISGTEVRAMVGRGERPPETFMRPEIAQFLVDKAKNGRVFF